MQTNRLHVMRPLLMLAWENDTRMVRGLDRPNHLLKQLDHRAPRPDSSSGEGNTYVLISPSLQFPMLLRLQSQQQRCP